jgi:hypothetical protein
MDPRTSPAAAARACGYCHQAVLMGPGAPAHVHDPKVCRTCTRELPISEFPAWPSSVDGHRHTCADCSMSAHQSDVAAQRTQRSERRTAWNEELRRRGFRWHRSRTGWELVYILSGRPVTEHEAAQIVEQLEDADDVQRESGRWGEPPF